MGSYSKEISICDHCALEFMECNHTGRHDLANKVTYSCDKMKHNAEGAVPWKDEDGSYMWSALWFCSKDCLVAWAKCQ